MKKFFWMFAIAACMSLFSAQSASGCANDDLSHDTHEHAAKVVKAVPQSHAATATTLNNESVPGKLAVKNVNAKPTADAKAAKAATTTTVALQDDDGFEMAGGSCIHGCGCSGPKSHRRSCGTNGDCHGHEGLLCTWASGGGGAPASS